MKLTLSNTNIKDENILTKEFNISLRKTGKIIPFPPHANDISLTVHTMTEHGFDDIESLFVQDNTKLIINELTYLPESITVGKFCTIIFPDSLKQITSVTPMSIELGKGSVIKIGEKTLIANNDQTDLTAAFVGKSEEDGALLITDLVSFYNIASDENSFVPSWNDNNNNYLDEMSEKKEKQLNDVKLQIALNPDLVFVTAVGSNGEENYSAKEKDGVDDAISHQATLGQAQIFTTTVASNDDVPILGNEEDSDSSDHDIP